MKIPVIYHTLKPLVDIGIDKFNTTDGKEMDHETTTIFFSSLFSSSFLGVVEDRSRDQANSLWFRNPCNCIPNQMLLHISDACPLGFN